MVEAVIIKTGYGQIATRRISKMSIQGATKLAPCFFLQGIYLVEVIYNLCALVTPGPRVGVDEVGSLAGPSQLVELLTLKVHEKVRDGCRGNSDEEVRPVRTSDTCTSLTSLWSCLVAAYRRSATARMCEGERELQAIVSSRADRMYTSPTWNTSLSSWRLP